MAATDPDDEISELSSKLASVEAVLDPGAMRAEAESLREQAADPDLWGDQQPPVGDPPPLLRGGRAARLEDLRQRLDDTRVMFELADSENDEPTRAEAQRDLASLRKEIDQLEVRTLLSGEYDAREALVSINAQAGGADAADFAQNLMRMYQRWAERHGYPTEVYDIYAEEAGSSRRRSRSRRPTPTARPRRARNAPDGADLQVRQPGPRQPPSPAWTWYQSSSRPTTSRSTRTRSGSTCTGPAGPAARASTHRLGRPDHPPADRDRCVLPERAQPDPEPRLGNVRSAGQTARAQAPGGGRQMAALRGESTGSWGTQIRNYVLYPYQNVKDVRTGMETGNTTAVLDGEIDDFIEAEIRWLRRGQNGEKN